MGRGHSLNAQVVGYVLGATLPHSRTSSTQYCLSRLRWRLHCQKLAQTTGPSYIGY